MLRLYLWCLTMLLFIGQAFADVTVYVDMKQTGPTHLPFSGVDARVGKNVDATYSATANYNGKPTLHAEEKITTTTWAYTVPPITDVTRSPASGNGSSATITAKSAEAGTYVITVTFEVTFTITKYKADGTVDSTRTAGPYTDSGSATLNVKDGKFGVFIRPADNFPLYDSDAEGYRNKLGVGEDATILVFPKEGSTDTVTFDYATPSCSPSVAVNGSSIVAGDSSGSETIQVYAVVNGVLEGPESIGVTVVEPQGIRQVKIAEINIPAGMCGAGFIAASYIFPTDVSFKNIFIGEGTCYSKATGSLWPAEDNIVHPAWSVSVSGGNVVDGCLVQGPNAGTPPYDTILGGVPNPSIGVGTFTWEIPWEYTDSNMTKHQFTKLIHITTLDGNRGATTSKAGNSAQHTTP